MSMRKFNIDPIKPFFIYDTAGDWLAFKLGEYIYDLRGEYIGFTRTDMHDVYTASGEWIGNLIQDGRIVRKRNYQRPPLLKSSELPVKPEKIRIPNRAPLPPQTADLGFSLVDVLEWDPDVFKRLSDLVADAGEETQ
ncbi:MAG: hypothetical protein HC828_16995 [Blastochloris sp.]|nr:hypothetical protein [Blastochloris sp.]